MGLVMDLSVIIPVCNMQSCIAACLRSVTRCPRDTIAMECLVVDGGSTDETAAVVKRYIQRDGRIRLVSSGNGGTAGARNTGIAEASGNYIMFLDACDRLCEDAWEQIEAAVEEEYADFIAFSYITLRANGKFKAQMLPISDVVSTDAQEAGRLMYADSVFDTCGGTLFRSSIIKDRQLAFRTDMPFGEDSLFAAEYFGYCESYLMTKAMIVYCPRRECAAQGYSIRERLDYIQVLYECNKAAVMRCGDGVLMKCMQVYYLKALAKLFCEYAGVYRRDKAALAAAYQEAFVHEITRRILDETDGKAIPSIIKRYEYRLLKEGSLGKVCRYFSVKAVWRRN